MKLQCMSNFIRIGIVCALLLAAGYLVSASTYAQSANDDVDTAVETLPSPMPESTVLETICPSCLPVPSTHVADWPVFTSESGGYAVKVPPEWTVTESTEYERGRLVLHSPVDERVNNIYIGYMGMEKPTDVDLVAWLYGYDAMGIGAERSRAFVPVLLGTQGGRDASQQAYQFETYPFPVGQGYFLSNRRLVLQVFTLGMRDNNDIVVRQIAESIAFTDDAPRSLSELGNQNLADPYGPVATVTPTPYVDDGLNPPVVATPQPQSPLAAPDDTSSESLSDGSINPIPEQDGLVRMERPNRYGDPHPSYEIWYDPSLWSVVQQHGNSQLHLKKNSDCRLSLNGFPTGVSVDLTVLAGYEWTVVWSRERAWDYVLDLMSRHYYTFTMYTPEYERYDPVQKTLCQQRVEEIVDTFALVDD